MTILINEFMYELQPKELFETLKIEEKDWNVFVEDFCNVLSSSSTADEFLKKCNKFPTILLAMLLAQLFAGRGFLALRKIYKNIWGLLVACWVEKVEKDLEEKGDEIITPLFYFKDLQHFPKPLLIMFLWFICDAIGKYIRLTPSKYVELIQRRRK